MGNYNLFNVFQIGSVPKEEDVEDILVKKTGRTKMAVSAQGEKGRLRGSLCSHVGTNGDLVFCKRLETNLRFVDALKSRYGDREGRKRLLAATKEAYELVRDKPYFFERLRAGDIYPLALVLAELSKLAPAAIGVSACAGYISGGKLELDQRAPKTRKGRKSKK